MLDPINIITTSEPPQFTILNYQACWFQSVTAASMQDMHLSPALEYKVCIFTNFFTLFTSTVFYVYW